MSQSNPYFYGSLENQERQRIIEESKSETESLASRTTLATTTMEMPKPRPRTIEQEPEVLEFSEESKQAMRRHEELQKKMELQKKAQSIIVPTNDNEVRMQLRELHEPITYFAEGPGDRRDRQKTNQIDIIEAILRQTNVPRSILLKHYNKIIIGLKKFNILQESNFLSYYQFLRLKKLLAEIFLETGELPHFAKPKAQIHDESQEQYVYEGSEELQKARLKITQYSLKAAAIRIENSKLKRERTDPLEEEEAVDKDLSEIPNYKSEYTQFADDNCVSKGCFSPDSTEFATAGWSGKCKVWSVSNDGTHLKTQLIGHKGMAIDIKFHPQYGTSNKILASCGADHLVRVWNLADEQEDFQTSEDLKGHEDRVNKVRFHPTGNYLVTSSHDKTWKLWDLETQKSLITQTGHGDKVYACAMQQDGSLVFTGDFGGYGMLWDIRIGKGILPLVGHTKQVICADFHPNGYHLATGSDDNTVRLWDIRRKNCFNQLPAHNKLVSDIMFQPTHGRYLATSSYDSSCKIWSSKDWSLQRQLAGTNSKITCISISNNLEYISTTSLDRKWSLWTKKDRDSLF